MIVCCCEVGWGWLEESWQSAGKEIVHKFPLAFAQSDMGSPVEAVTAVGREEPRPEE